MKIDMDHTKTLTLSADLFYYIKDGERPLCESWEEIDEGIANLKSIFPGGFTIGRWSVEDSGEIKADFSPVEGESPAHAVSKEEPFNYDYFITLTTDTRMEIKFNKDKTKVSTRWYSKTHGGSNYQKYDVQTASNGNPFIKTQRGSIFWLTENRLTPKEA